MKLKKLVTKMLLSAIFISSINFTAFAKAGNDLEFKEGQEWRAVPTMYKDGLEEESMCNIMFSEDADILVKEDSVIIKLYVVDPVPAFAAKQGDMTTLENFRSIYNGSEFNGKLEADNKIKKTMKNIENGFEIEGGEKLPCDTISIELPKDALLEDRIKSKAYVNIYMKTDATFDIELNDFRLIKDVEDSKTETEGGIINDNGESEDHEDDGTVEKPSTSVKTQEVKITAEVKGVASDYTVVIPPSVKFRDLKETEDNKEEYKVSVKNIKSGRVKVSAEKDGYLQLKGGKDKIKFINNFGTQEFDTDKVEIKGELTIKGSDIKNKAPGEYKGTTKFVIEHISE